MEINWLLFITIQERNDTKKTLYNVDDPEFEVEVGDKSTSGKWYSKLFKCIIAKVVLFSWNLILIDSSALSYVLVFSTCWLKFVIKSIICNYDCSPQFKIVKNCAMEKAECENWKKMHPLLFPCKMGKRAIFYGATNVAVLRCWVYT